MKSNASRAAVACRAGARFTIAAAAVLCGASGAADAFVMDVVWTEPRCDFVVTKNAAGHGIALRMTALDLKIGDQLDGALDEIGYIRKIAKVGTDEAAMFQIRKFGIRRKVAYDLVYEWSRQCNPPEE